MDNDQMTKEQLMKELAEAHRLIAELQKQLKTHAAEITKANELLTKEIEDRKQTEKALRESAEKYRIHFSVSNDVMFSWDNQFRVLSVSPNVERLLGYKPEELIGKTFDEVGVLHPDYMEEAVDNAVHLLCGKAIFGSIYEFIAKGGARKFGEISGIPLLKDNKVVAIISVAREITERIEIEKALRERTETARALLSACSESLILLDTSGTVLDLNEVAAKKLGKSVKEVLGSSILDHLPKDVVDRRKIYFEQIIYSGKPVRFKDERKGKLIHTNLHPVRNIHGKVTRIAVFTQTVKGH